MLLPIEILGEPGAWWQLTFAHPPPVAPVIVETGDEPETQRPWIQPSRKVDLLFCIYRGISTFYSI